VSGLCLFVDGGSNAGEIATREVQSQHPFFAAVWELTSSIPPLPGRFFSPPAPLRASVGAFAPGSNGLPYGPWERTTQPDHVRPNDV
jgi:hypothetical protein